MFTAKGVSFLKLPAGTYQATVKYLDDATQKVVLQETYVVATKPALLAKVATQLQQLKQNADDATVNADIVGKTLGTI